MNQEQYLDALLTLPGMWGPQVSPDGKWVAWTWFRTGPAADVYAVPTDGSSSPIRFTETEDNTFLVSWTPDSRAVLVEQDKDGNERAALYQVDLDDPLKMKPLTPQNPDYFIRGGNLHPDNRWLVYGMNYDVEKDAEIEQTWIYRHDLETGERIALAKPEKSGYITPLLSPTGEHVLYSRKDRHPSGTQVWLVSIEGENDREIVNLGDDIKSFARWFPDGKRVLVIGETDTHRKIGVWTVADESLNWILDDPQRDIQTAFVPHGSEHIVLIENEQARLRSVLFHPETGEEIRLPDVPGNLQLLAPTPTGEWVGMYFSSHQPADVVRFELDHIKPDSFVSLSQVWDRTALTPDDLAQAEEFNWKSVDGLSIHGWLYRPEGKARGTIVYVHGGPTGHSQDSINNQIQFFVREGFNVLDPNYRGSTGYGLEFREKIKEDGWGGREQDDIRAGIEALITQGIAEERKVGITGTSYGGYSSWCAITRFPRKVLAASAPVCGMTDLVVDYETTRPDLRPYSEEMLGGSPEEVPQTYYDRSPINFLDQIKGHLLIVQGMQDPNVTPANVHVVTQRLQQANVEYQILAFEDEGHGISKPKNQKKMYQYLADFFTRAFDHR